MSRSDYWQHKLSIFLHDPVHKPLRIQGHEGRAAEIARFLHQQVPGKESYQSADCIASGLTRAGLPGYNRDESQNGAVDFLSAPKLTHPLVPEHSASFDIPGEAGVDEVHARVLDLLKKDLGEGLSAEELDLLRLEKHEAAPLNAFFSRSSDPEQWSRALYMYLFFALRKRLRMENVGNLGGLWDFIPADTRMPDHSLWHHCGLTSAMGSAMADDPDGKVSLAVFSITPVQPFIAKARKLRDHWVGSVILSYLSFAGIRHIIRTLGPDHVMYPSLHDQSLVEMFLGQEFHLAPFLKEADTDLARHLEESASIASFPNKFVFLAPAGRTGEICREIEQAVQKEWVRLAGMVRDYLGAKTGAGQTMKELFDHQVSDYWQFSYAGTRFLELDDRDGLSVLLHRSKWSDEAGTVERFAAPFGANGKQYARLYGATHTAVQSLLAAVKMKPGRVRKAQNGEKCPLCGEHEVLHDFASAGRTRAFEYKKGVTGFWDLLRGRMNSQESFAQVGRNERVCAVCAVKRFLPMALQSHKDEILHRVLCERDARSFPSTTEMAAREYLYRLTEKVTITREEYPSLVDALHEAELDIVDDEKSDAVRRIRQQGREKGIEFQDRDKYYAVLMMDGDKMGDLVNGATITASWQDVIHPELRRRFEHAGFCKASPLRGMLQDKRTLNPALHAAISDSLNGFARYGVAPVIRRGHGKLIYAGGDDVCAIMPLNTVLESADAIRRAYNLGFVRYSGNGAEPLEAGATAEGCKLGMHLGQGAGISISGAIVIAHHKQPLREVLRDAHALLDGVAKEKAGRNALAVRLKKRSGGDRDLWFNWDMRNRFRSEPELLSESFAALMRDVTDDEVASRLIYRLGQLEGAVEPLAVTEEALAANRDRIVRLFGYEVRHSGKLVTAATEKERDARLQVLAERLAGICVQGPSSAPDWFNPDAAIVARFLAPQYARGEK